MPKKMVGTSMAIETLVWKNQLDMILGWETYALGIVISWEYHGICLGKLQYVQSRLLFGHSWMI